MRFVLIPGGKFIMGNDTYDDTMPMFEVTIKPFLMGQYLVTQKEWMGVMGTNPSYFKKGGRYPVEQVSWDDCQVFIDKFQEKMGVKKYRLPSESEWEYACRGGSTGIYYWGDEKIDNYCWYDENSNSATHPVGEKLANAFGLYDMNGNAWEWCADDYYENYNNTPTDGTPYIATSVKYKIFRGGRYWKGAELCSSVDRFWVEPENRWRSLGFRFSRSI